MAIEFFWLPRKGGVSYFLKGLWCPLSVGTKKFWSPQRRAIKKLWNATTLATKKFQLPQNGPTKFLQLPILVATKYFSVTTRGRLKWDKVWRSKIFNPHPIVTIFKLWSNCVSHHKRRGRGGSYLLENFHQKVFTKHVACPYFVMTKNFWSPSKKLWRLDGDNIF
jgi:hypothetical protein